MVFYSRYFIHEMPLVFFIALTLGAAWRYAQSRSAHWAALTGAGLGLMFATKETFVLTVPAMGLAAIATVRGPMRTGTHGFSGVRASSGAETRGNDAAFQLSKPKGLKPGTYKVIVFLGDDSAETKVFVVKK